MDLCLQRLMNRRMQLTKICVTKQNDGKEKSESNDTSPEFKYDPPIRYKEHALSHAMEDIRNLGIIHHLRLDF